jgi:predicted O-linked N-acetylglucosamine transferase (SPINDLY family)
LAEAEALLREAVVLHRAGRLAEAQRIYAQVLAADPEHPGALHLSGLVAHREGRLDDAIDLVGRAIARAPGSAVFHGNLGNLCKDAGRRDEAMAALRRALELDPGHVPARNNLGVLLLEGGENQGALEHFRTVIVQRPDHFRAHFNAGNALQRLGAPEAALAAWRQALELAPDFAEALEAAGGALLARGRFAEAIPLLRRRAALAEHSADAQADLALALHRHGDLEDAAVCYARALALAPDALEVVCNDCALLQKICAWERLAVQLPLVVRAIEDGRAGVPLGLLVSQPGFTPELQLAAARANAAAFTGLPPVSSRHDGSAATRLRIGYVSADFREHATAWLTAELFELHDRQRFEIVLVSHGPDDGGASRRRLQRAADRFLDVAALADEGAARRIADERLDVLVDLNGSTDNARMGIAARRPAPLQVNWLGFPGTLGAACYDYLIADRYVVPPGSEEHYSEAVVRLPDCYQSHDRKRSRPADAPDRAAHGLPADACVLCCFNQSFKITASMFALWMRVLAAAPQAVLWLLDDNPVATATLRRRADALGVAPARLVFAPHAAHDAHLARYLAADLAIDTYPCVSHTTASDALWMGCPLITLTGTTFASRVAGSVLASAALSDCVAGAMPAYEAMLAELVRDPPRIAALRRRLDLARSTAPLFDTQRFVRHLEAAYARMTAGAARGERPQGFDVG